MENEKGYYHPERGYWQTLAAPSQDILDAYPAGTIEVPLQPSNMHSIVNGAWQIDPAKEQAAQAVIDARAASEAAGQSALARVRGNVPEADFIAAVKWAMKQ